MLYTQQLFSPGPKEGKGAPGKTDELNEDDATVNTEEQKELADSEDNDDINESDDYDESEELDDPEALENPEEETDTIL